MIQILQQRSLRTHREVSGVAGRLGWPFIELFPSPLGDPNGANQIRGFFATIALLEACVVFIDEVDDVAARRSDNPARQATTNELLKAIPSFRAGRDRLLICATNDIAALDAAFHRPGRFDCLIPVGLPDEPARRAIWQLYVPPPHAKIDIDVLVQHSGGFTPADIAHAAATAAQRIFERAISTGHADIGTRDYLDVLTDCTPSIDPDALQTFHELSQATERW